MPRRPSLSRRWLTAATWPVGITMTSWAYMWRTTVMHRREIAESDLEPHLPPAYPEGVETAEVQSVQAGYGPLFHRRYTTTIRDSPLSPDGLIDRLRHDVNAAAPTAFARFQRVAGEGDALALGDEYVVRMPGPWDGPVRVIADNASAFRLATLQGHLEAGQIEFRSSSVGEDGSLLGFEIESWARSSGRFSDLLYHHAHMSKEIQLHMWVSFLEGVVELSDGRMTGGVDIDTRRVDEPELA
jgi:hypothetical protein